MEQLNLKDIKIKTTPEVMEKLDLKELGPVPADGWNCNKLNLPAWKEDIVLSFQVDSGRWDVSKVIGVIQYFNGEISYDVEAFCGDTYLTDDVVFLGRNPREARKELRRKIREIRSCER